MDLEHKALPFEFKAEEGDERTFSGYGGAFLNVDDTQEIIAPGAFEESLPEFRKSGILAWQHDWTTPIGKPLEAYEDARGLFLKARISDTYAGRDAYTLLKDGVIQKMSIGFRTTKSQKLDKKGIESFWGASGYVPTPEDRARSEKGARLLTGIRLYEVSLVSVPANSAAEVTAVKSLTDEDEARREQALRAYGKFQQLRLPYPF